MYSVCMMLVIIPFLASSALIILHQDLKTCEDLFLLAISTNFYHGKDNLEIPKSKAKRSILQAKTASTYNILTTNVSPASNLESITA